MQYFELSDEELVSQLASLCLDGRRGVARLIVHLTEVEDRRIDKKSACDSMWSFCTKRMRMSEGETSRRLNGVKLVRRFPSLLGRIERGEIHLSSLKILGPYLDESNVEELLDAAKWMTKMEVRELVASRFARPAAPPVDSEAPATIESLAFGEAGAKTVSSIEPQSGPGRYVHAMLSPEAYANLTRAKDLMRHRVPDGDTSKVLEKALELLVKQLEKERLGKTSRPQKARRPSKPGHIPAAVRREVFERDGEQCTFLDAQGRRCECRKLLELDHILPRARGGTEEVSNLRVVCRAHNRFYAEEVFGEEYVAERIHYRQHQAQRVMNEEPVMTQTGLVPIVHEAKDPSEGAARCGTAIARETVEQAARGLLNMGFGKKDVLRALEAIIARPREATSVQDLLRQGIAALT